MKLRLDIATNKRSPAWPWILHTMKQFKTHQVRTSEGLEIHSITAATAAELAPVWWQVHKWQMVNVYKDDILVARSVVYSQLFKEKSEDNALSRLVASLEASIKKPVQDIRLPPADQED